MIRDLLHPSDKLDNDNHRAETHMLLAHMHFHVTSSTEALMQFHLMSSEETLVHIHLTKLTEAVYWSDAWTPHHITITTLQASRSTRPSIKPRKLAATLCPGRHSI